MKFLLMILTTILFFSPLHCTVDDEEIVLENKICDYNRDNADCITGYECKCDDYRASKSCFCRKKTTASTQQGLSSSSPQPLDELSLTRPNSTPFTANNLDPNYCFLKRLGVFSPQ